MERLALGFLAAALVGCLTPIPMLSLLTALNRQSHWAYAVGGATAMALVCLVFFGPRYVSPLAVLAGGFSGLAFRAVCRP